MQLQEEEEDDLTNRDDDEEPSKRSELSDKVKVTAVVELEPIAAAASEDEPQPLQDSAAPKTLGIMKKRRTDSLVSNSGKLFNNPRMECSIDSQVQPVIISG